MFNLFNDNADLFKLSDGAIDKSNKQFVFAYNLLRDNKIKTLDFYMMI